MPIVDIRRTHVNRWRDQLVERVSAATVNTGMGTLSSLFAWCIDQAWIEHTRVTV